MSNAQANEDPFDAVGGVHRDPARLQSMFAFLNDEAHLVSPVTSCSVLPLGCSVSMSVVRLDRETDAHSVGGGKFSLLKHALMRLANAAGVVWVPNMFVRLDDKRDPRRVWMRVTGYWFDFAMQRVPIVGEIDLDLRDGSDLTASILAAARGDSAEEKRRKGEENLMAQRARIVSHAETKAKLRALRATLGIRAYSARDFEKPWVVARIQWTGHSSDAALQRDNAIAIRDAMLGSNMGLFGLPEPQRAIATIAAPPPRRELVARQEVIDVPSEAQPPVPRRRTEPRQSQTDDVQPGSGPEVEAQAGPEAPPEAPTAVQPQPVPSSEPSSAPKAKPTFDPSASAEGVPTLVMPFGKHKGRPITEVDDRTLLEFEASLERDLADPKKERFHAKAAVDISLVRDELDGRRASEDHDQTPAPTRKF